MFLMHRVELKELYLRLFNSIMLVPNAPCGVESIFSNISFAFDDKVPNAPCGVERCHFFP